MGLLLVATPLGKGVAKMATPCSIGLGGRKTMGPCHASPLYCVPLEDHSRLEGDVLDPALQHKPLFRHQAVFPAEK